MKMLFSCFFLFLFFVRHNKTGQQQQLECRAKKKGGCVSKMNQVVTFKRKRHQKLTYTQTIIAYRITLPLTFVFFLQLEFQKFILNEIRIFRYPILKKKEKKNSTSDSALHEPEEEEEEKRQLFALKKGQQKKQRTEWQLGTKKTTNSVQGLEHD